MSRPSSPCRTCSLQVGVPLRATLEGAEVPSSGITWTWQSGYNRERGILNRGNHYGPATGGPWRDGGGRLVRTSRGRPQSPCGDLSRRWALFLRGTGGAGLWQGGVAGVIVPEASDLALRERQFP